MNSKVVNPWIDTSTIKRKALRELVMLLTGLPPHPMDHDTHNWFIRIETFDAFSDNSLEIVTSEVQALLRKDHIRHRPCREILFGMLEAAEKAEHAFAAIMQRSAYLSGNAGAAD